MSRETGTFVLLVCWGLAAGAAIAVQSGVNAQLARRLGHPALATTASFVIGTAALVLYCVALRLPWPDLAEAARMPWWVWTGGLLGACFVASTTMLAPRLGATGLIAVVIAGQLMASLVLDHFGLVGFTPRPLSAARVGGALLLVAGVALVLKS